MGFFKKLGEKFAEGILKSMVKSSGVESLNPYIGMLLKAEPTDLIADEKFRLSMVLKEGAYGVFHDNERAKEYCRMAAEEGHPCAMVMYVQWLMRNQDEPTEEILSWLSKASELGERQALYNLSISYHRGDFGTPDISKSFKLLRKAVERGYVPAFYRMAIIYANGDDGVEKCLKKARFFAFEGFLKGDDDCRQLLNQLINEEERITGKIHRDKVFEDARNIGEPMATVALAQILLEEKNDREKAIELLSSDINECSEKDDLLGMLLWANKQYEEALNYSEKAANEGFDYSQALLALAYYRGLGKEQNLKLALEWIIKSINQGNPYARRLFSEMIMSNDCRHSFQTKL